MKKIIFILSLLVSGTMGFAQCDKPLMLTSSKTEHLDANGTVQRTEDEKSTVEVNKTDVIIRPGNESHNMKGVIKSNTCNWSVPFKEGKSLIKATITNDNGNTMNATLTIEGKDGKLTLLMEVEEMPDRKIRVPIDTFEEKK
ncbi:MAG: hypothetical protein ICV79_26655 [Flavisolibacter sp.]|nr:hypothetical protein [Flavisolibacter sp.]